MKTNKIATPPVSPYSLHVLNKYGGEMPKISDVKYNKYQTKWSAFYLIYTKITLPDEFQLTGVHVENAYGSKFINLKMKVQI